MVNIIKKLVPESKYGIKCPYSMTPTRIVVHNTANDATARNEIAYMTNNNYETSFHYAVDDKEIVQGLPLDRNGWHSSDGNGKGNREGIAIEICYSKSGCSRFIKAEENAVDLIVYLLKKYNWGIDRVTKHQDYGNHKYCPHRTLDMGWNRFINMIKAKIEDKPEPSSNVVNCYYKVRTQKHQWLPEVKNLDDYAGYENSPITGLAIKVDKGSIRYRVHLKGKGWLPFVTGYDINDFNNGFAGDGVNAIDCVECYYYTPDNIRPFKKAKYKVNNYPYQYDNEKNKGQDGYAGVYGVTATKFQIIIE
jgi:N-acetyl-anhydromuramyl-L-alanine amidase AmpD|nr:MAG TPA: N-acetylmuramoyl-L-alanine amidase [Caudoviricetes sp.]